MLCHDKYVYIAYPTPKKKLCIYKDMCHLYFTPLNLLYKFIITISNSILIPTYLNKESLISISNNKRDKFVLTLLYFRDDLIYLPFHLCLHNETSYSYYLLYFLLYSRSEKVFSVVSK